MIEINTTITWQRNNEKFIDGRYSRAHTWNFDGGFTVPASSSPHVVPIPYSVESAVDPEEAFVASLSSCHMLWFLSIAAKRGFVLDSYHDSAVGEMSKNEDGKLFVSVVRLRPCIGWNGDAPDGSQILAMHEEAHASCFIANSVLTTIYIDPTSDRPDTD
ncbi:MAG TPA: OsmC family protein [Pirellulaceae bacterium]|nr:OsmC family protein [Pirellulaceae bacterium]HMO91947.1 OsmC family protein [Pirellulaceae bacterium]HMP68746.1 OsmC family protein [Pirellulaceae bacterium]